MRNGFVRVGASSLHTAVANCKQNAEGIIEKVKDAAKEEVKILALPELCVTSSTCGDLYWQRTLQKEAEEAILYIAFKTKNEDVLFVVGAPLLKDDQLYDCAVVIHKGKILGIVPKTYVLEDGEQRSFNPYKGKKNSRIYLGNRSYPFGNKLLFVCKNHPALTIAVELNEDLNVPASPSINHSLAGAKVILNLASSKEIIGMKEFRNNLISVHSNKLNCAYVYASAGLGESTTDNVYSGHCLIAENGEILKETKLFTKDLIYTEVDLERLQYERKNNFFNNIHDEYKEIYFTLDDVNYDLTRKVCPTPFLSVTRKSNYEIAKDILEIQAQGLIKRLEHINCDKVVIGISGGLDSTLAILVINEAFEKLGYNKSNIYAITMPCFGTSKRTYNNAYLLTNALGITLKEISIKDAVLQHFKDIKHNKDQVDVTYENSQARERTQVLMDFSNKVNGLVIGTGDLSELALGWATYNGDHMSMYGVNASVPKTLVQFVVEEIAKESKDDLKKVLLDILYTPISPELLPTNEGEIAQKTEDNVGPYELNDFFLYYTLRYGFTPEKIYLLAKKAFDKYDKETIKKWLKKFYWRFFSQQFKRSCLPDGMKIGEVSLSPRGDWKMPSDASSKNWIERVEKI